MSKKHKATFYVQVVPEFAYWDKDKVIGAKVVKMTQEKPQKPVAGCQIVKLTLNLDEDLFVPKTPAIDISLSKQNIAAPEVVDQQVVWSVD